MILSEDGLLAYITKYSLSFWYLSNLFYLLSNNIMVGRLNIYKNIAFIMLVLFNKLLWYYTYFTIVINYYILGQYRFTERCE